MSDEAKAVLEGLARHLQEHADHEWVEVPPCVYCKPCKVRLYQGELPEEKMPVGLAAQRAACEHLNHEMYDDGAGAGGAMGEGFFWVCADCGFKDWYE